MAPRKPDKAWTDKIVADLVAYAITRELGYGIGIAHHKPETAAPYTCLMCRPREEYDDGFTVCSIMRGLHTWPQTYCERCLRRMMVSGKYRGW